VDAFLSSLLFTTWGLCILAALDSTIFFFLPFAVDIGVVYLSARNPQFFWVYAILVSGISLLGAATSFYLGKRIGEAELERFISAHKSKKVIARVRKKGAIALAALDMIPPPFPFSAFVLTAGALEMNALRFFVAMFCFRLLRFGSEALLASIFGTSVVRFIESPTVRLVAEIFTVVIVGGSIISVYMFLRKVRRKPASSSKPHAAA
jgi:membrane protein YqaA with SNARE-associated domain